MSHIRRALAPGFSSGALTAFDLFGVFNTYVRRTPADDFDAIKGDWGQVGRYLYTAIDVIRADIRELQPRLLEDIGASHVRESA